MSQNQSKGNIHKIAEAESTAKADNSALNFGKLFEQFRVPGVDLNALVETQRKNIEAMQEATQKVQAGAAALAQRQVEMVTTALEQWQTLAKEWNVTNPAETAAKQADLAKKAIENALTNMRELAEIAATSQAQAYEVVGKRVQASLEEFRDYLKKAS